ncbi:hypothetical protein R3P38DRAFT_3068532 [Favolaschia claudopus]|uniref:Uncharacterized protein n=1 Tax=Favolaschia claudopus TaxID=2862362 RepID=A0AAW0A1R4_9AGAR
MKMWSGRSGQCPLSVSVYTSYTHLSLDEPMSPQADPLSIDLFLKELSSHAKRWKHVSFVTTSAAFKALAHLSVEDVPILQSITIRLPPPFPPDDVTRNSEWTQFGMFAGPRVSKFSTSGSCFSPSIPIHWHLLTDLDIGGSVRDSRLDSEGALEVLSRCPQLQKLTLATKATSDPVPLGYPPVELPHLHFLELDVGPNGPVLSHLRAPELRRFILRGPIASLPSFLSLYPHLESFANVANAPMIPFDDDVLAALELHSCCPLLEEFTLMAAHTVSDRALQQFQVRVLFSRPMELDIKTGLKPFLDAGLNIETVYPTGSQTSVSPWSGLADAPRPPSGPVLYYPAHWDHY